MNWSIHARQSIVVGILLAIFIAITGLSIEYANRSVAKNATQGYLRGQLYSLVSATSIDEVSGKTIVKSSIDPRFHNIDTGLYSVITDSAGKIVWQSNSSVTLDFSNVAARSSINEQEFDQLELTDNILGDNNNVIERSLSVNHMFFSVGVGDSKEIYNFHVAENINEEKARLNQFRFALWISLLVLSVFLMLGLAVAIGWSLKPLRQIADKVEEINRGEKERIEGEPVREIAGLTTRLNTLLESERIRRERFKNSLGDLAHSLKTPLAVMQSEVETKGKVNQATIFNQVARMREIVDYQLRRASMASSSDNLERIELTAVFQSLANTLRKVYHAKRIDIDLNLPNQQFYPIEKGDFMEVFGNIMDNACKYGDSKVRVSLKNGVSPTLTGLSLIISVEDDGGGIDEESGNKIMQRGYRLDETRHKSGQGLGLALASDIVDSYGGSMEIKRSKLGGAEFIVYLPISEN